MLTTWRKNRNRGQKENKWWKSLQGISYGKGKEE